MSFNPSVTAIVVIIALTIAAAAFRVSTAPERIRQRLETAKSTCLSTGGEWIKVGRDELCQPAATAQKM